MKTAYEVIAVRYATRETTKSEVFYRYHSYGEPDAPIRMDYYEELELDRPFEILVNLDEMYRAYDTLRELSERPGAALVAGHDPAVLGRFRSAGGDGDGLAVRIA